ncbi:hypothetical protein L3X38_036493 [Prunus dulcis]|uniref:Uncharacterized protein n=1 Tax=Prunus dulcis TaxID=3755 RepID=A0AAD4V3F3_PRUDU|nr:hypothetical protein L3X38_036493 [Prunus dulcis]
MTKESIKGTTGQSYCCLNHALSVVGSSSFGEDKVTPLMALVLQFSLPKGSPYIGLGRRALCSYFRCGTVGAGREHDTCPRSKVSGSVGFGSPEICEGSPMLRGVKAGTLRFPCLARGDASPSAPGVQRRFVFCTRRAADITIHRATRGQRSDV